MLSPLGLWTPQRAYAQQQAFTSHSYVFGQSARFRLTLPPGIEPESAAFYLTIGGITDALTVAVTDGGALVTRDLAVEPLPPFASVTYWWEYTDPGGRIVETAEQVLRYVDNRYAWQSVERQDVRVHWIAGERALMVQAVEVARGALTGIREALEAPAGDPVDIYIYPSETDLQSALQLGGRAWVSGMAYPELGVVLVAIAPTDDAIMTMQRGIPHELTHKVLYDLLGKHGYASLPTWLNEGLATHAEARPAPEYGVILNQAHYDGSLIPIADLCYPFPHEPDLMRLAYAQSGSLVAFIRQTHGWSGLRELLHAYADGLSCSTGVKTTFGTDLPQLERAWRIWLEQAALPPESAGSLSGAVVFLRDTGPWLILAGALLLPVAIHVATSRRA